MSKKFQLLIFLMAIAGAYLIATNGFVPWVKYQLGGNKTAVLGER